MHESAVFDIPRFNSFGRVAVAPELRGLAPRVAVDAILRLLVDGGAAVAASVWVLGPDEELECVAAVGAGGATTFRLPLARFGKPAGELVLAGADETIAAEAADAIEQLLERDLLLERNAERERAITGSLEKRLTRLALDLHDGVLQDLAALGADLALMRKQVASVLEEDERPRVGGRFDDIQARLTGLDGTLRDLLAAVRGGGMGYESLERRIAQQVAAFRDDTGLDAQVEIAGDFGRVSESRRIAVFRIVQEALANIREHSRARRVHVRIAEHAGSVDVAIEDDGIGFELGPTLAGAVRAGRVGLIGMRERVRLLGGALRIETSAGGGTCVSFALAPWVPFGGVPEPEEQPV
jgi:signal transduction histidine kinase